MSPHWVESAGHINASEQAGRHFDILIASLELADYALNDKSYMFG
jgi:hypothetical protein